MVETIDITQLQQRMDFHPNMAAADSLLDKVHLLSVTGLQGSSRALFAASLFRRAPRNYLYILNDAESAGYFYHDLTQLMGSDNVLFFTSAYKRAARYGQLDAANEVLRTETLSRLQGDSGPLIIVSYPIHLQRRPFHDQLAEKTLLSTGERVTPFVSEVLDSYGFQYVDYGMSRQYAVGKHP